MRGLPQLTNAAASKLAAYKQLLQHLLHTKIVFIISYIQATVIAFISSSSLSLSVHPMRSFLKECLRTGHACSELL